MEKIPMTKTGYEALEKELRHLKSVERPAVIEAIATAREHGDLSENAEYHAARERQSFIEGRIQEVEAVISKAQIIDTASLKGDTVKFGATVFVVDEETDKEEEFTIVGEYETDVEKRRISITSPVARALVGKAVGDSVNVRSPKGLRTYEILKIVYRE